MKVQLTGYGWGTFQGDEVQVTPNDDMSLATIDKGQELAGGIAVLSPGATISNLTYAQWGGKILSDLKTFTVVMHQSVARVYKVKAVSAAHAETLTRSGDAGTGIPVQETWARPEYKAL